MTPGKRSRDQEGPTRLPRSPESLLPTPSGANSEKLSTTKAIYLGSHFLDLLSNYFSYLCLNETFFQSLLSVFLLHWVGKPG